MAKKDTSQLPPTNASGHLDIMVAGDAVLEGRFADARALFAAAAVHCVIRTRDSGVHMGTLAWHRDQHVVLVNARRLWSWQGANTLNEVASNGVATGSRIAQRIDVIHLLDALEIIPTTAKARATLDRDSW